MMSLMHDTEQSPPPSTTRAADTSRARDDGAPAWALVVPVKATHRAKTRVITEPEGLIDNAAIAAAFAYDTVAAALRSTPVRAVYVVTEDEQVAAGMRDLGAAVVGEQSALPVESPGFARLNEAIRTGELAARAAGAMHVAALTADLPALRPADLSAVLAAATRHARSYLADSTGIGTALLAAGPGAELDPQFGYDSAAAHAASGAVAIDVPATSVRTDVDTVDELTSASELGLGPRTAVLFSAYRERVSGGSAG